MYNVILYLDVGIYIFVYLYIYLYTYSPNKRSFRGPGGAGRDCRSGPKICARELASVASRATPRGLPWPSVDDGTDDMYSSKVSNTTLGPIF